MTEPRSANEPAPRRKKLLSFIFICIFQAANFISYNHVYSFLPLYNEERNISTAWTGGILAGNQLGFFFGPIFLGPILLSKFSTRVLLSATAICTGSCTMLFSLLDLVNKSGVFKALALLGRILIGFIGGCLNVFIFAALVAIYPERVGVVTAIGEAVLNGAVACAPFIGAILYSSGGFKPAFIVPGAIAFASAFPTIVIPNLRRESNEDEKDSVSAGKLWNLFDPWLLFPLWHLACSQILNVYHMPLLPLYAEEAFGADVVWSGTAQLVGSAAVCVSSPLLGMLIDRFGPYKMLLASCFSIPLVYICIGPLPLLSFISQSKAQLMISLAFLGIAIPMACIAALPVMFDVYRSKNQGDLPTWASNSLVSLYCAAYPLGLTIGSTVSGFIAPYASFGWSTGVLGLMLIAESLLCTGYCVRLMMQSR